MRKPSTLTYNITFICVCQYLSGHGSEYCALNSQFKLSPALKETLLDGFVDVCLRHHIIIIIIIITKNV